MTAHSSLQSGLPNAPGPSNTSRSQAALRFWDDPVLRVAFLTAGLLLAYQLAVTLLQPAWIGPVTDWLQMLVAWSGVLVAVLLSRWFARNRSLVARSWWFVSAGLFSYALARTLWLIENQFLTPHRVPQPSWLDLFFFVQYPCYLLALLHLPRVRPRIHMALVMLDGCLLLGAAFALSWYFLLAPIYQNSQETWLGKLVNLGYPVGDLVTFFGLTIIWLRYREYESARPVLVLLLVAIACLVIADSWYALLLLQMSSYQSGSPPDLFWLAFYLLLPLAGLMRFRLTQRTLAGANARPMHQQPPNLQRQDFIAALRVTSPVAAAWITSIALIVHADVVASALHPVLPPLIALGLMGLALLRQGLTAVDNERLRRQREENLRETTEQMETFLGITGHELRTPITSMRLGLQTVERRMRRLLQREHVEPTDVVPLLETVVRAEHQEEQLDQLVGDLVDVARVRAGKLNLHLAPTDLVTIVREAVEEQHQVNPSRTVHVECPKEQRAPVLGDAHRLGQVVTNYLTNALKYSPADQLVTVGIEVANQQAQVWVHDEGPGLSPEEQEQIWNRFYRAEGIEVQSGSGVGLGLGLHISRTIIEQHQGQVGVQSASGAGSTFWFSLPLMTPAPALERSQTGTPESSSRDGKGLEQHSNVQGELPADESWQSQ
jgi:signal transduction histidine kinase